MDISKEQYESVEAYNRLISASLAYELSNVNLISIIDYINECIQSSIRNGFCKADISVRVGPSDSNFLIERVVNLN